MNINDFTLRLLISGFVFYLLVASTVEAEALNLPTAPLTTTKSVQPNLMLLLDSSGSMNSVVVDSNSGYDSDSFSFSCSSNKKLSTNNSYFALIEQNTGKLTIYYAGGGIYDWGNSSGERCFDDDSTYNAYLNGNGTATGNGTSYYISSGTGTAAYTGSYLNWYFSNENQTDGDKFIDSGTVYRKKVGTKSRMEVAKEAAIELVKGLDNILVGLAEYDNSDGAYLLANIGDVDDSSQEEVLVNNIDGISASGSTPLGEALQGIGYYFTRGNASNLTLHPDSANNIEDASPSDIFLASTLDSSIDLPNEVITNWCQDSFILTMTDGLPTSDTNISSYLKEYYDSDSDYPEDVISAMYEMDIRPDLYKDAVGDTINNITTYVVGFSEELEDSEVLTEMATNGGGAGLFTASNSVELVDAFEAITDNIFSKVGSGSGAAFNSSTLSSNSVLYAAGFNSSKWSGSLQAYALSSDGSVASTALWDAATKLDAMTYSTRNIFTFNADSKKGAVFNQSNLSGTQLTDLQQGPKGTADADVASLIDYIKGDRTNEGSSSSDYRIRSSALGDIVNSAVVYVGAPEFDWPDYNGSNDVKFGASGKDYSSFVSGSAASRTPMLYVGANDGMLHGFNAESTGTNAGQEEMAYIPGIITSSESDKGLHYLAQYDYQHRFYVDSTPTVSDVYINGEWRTILVGGLRNGGKGIFALDVTDPSDFSASSADATLNAESLALWEFSSANDADFGYGYSKPTIAMMENGKWAVIIGNGYNNSGDGTAKLFILFIEEGIGGNWGVGSSYIEIDTKVGSSGTPNGLSTPRAVDIDGDSVVDRIYAGDLEGNMWAFDVDDDNTSHWSVAYKSGANPEALFVAQDSDGNTQPITTAPILALNTNTVTTTSTEPNLLVFFGTGKYIEESDKNSTDVMTYYGVWDDNDGGKTRSNLEERILITDGDARLLSGDNIDWTSDKGWYFDLLEQTSLNSNAFELGERVISNSTISSDILLFTTALPNVNNTDICVSNSESWIVAVDLNTGKAPSYSIFDVNDDDQMDDSDTSSSYDTDNDGVDNEKVSYSSVKTDSSMIVGNTIYIDNSLYGQSEDGDIVKEDARVISNTREGRLSWEELIRP